jgi:hypothetical protein
MNCYVLFYSLAIVKVVFITSIDNGHKYKSPPATSVFMPSDILERVTNVTRMSSDAK